MKKYNQLSPTQQVKAYNLFFCDTLKAIEQGSVTFGPNVEYLIDQCHTKVQTNKNKAFVEHILEIPEIVSAIEGLARRQAQSALYSEPEDVVICELEY